MFRRASLLALLLSFAPLAAGAAPESPDRVSDRAPRVRPYDGRSAALLLDGMARSRTVRALVDHLETLDVIVYVEMQPTLRRKLAGTLTWVTASGVHRYVRIALNPELMPNAAIAALAHELQHAVEVAEAPSIRDAESLESYYRTHGLSTVAHRNGWDTEAARLVGDTVRRQLASAPATRLAESIQAFNPDEWHIVYRRARSLLPR